MFYYFVSGASMVTAKMWTSDVSAWNPSYTILKTVGGEPGELGEHVLGAAALE